MRDAALLILAVVCATATAARAATDVDVKDSTSLGQALKAARPGHRIRLAPGTYGKVWAGAVHGTSDAPVVIEAADPAKPPVFRGGKNALHVSKCSHLIVRNLVVEGTEQGGINLDDGTDRDDPSHHIVLENLTLSDVGPAGNNDCIKLSGITDFTLRNCKFTGWGGAAVDMVGCHRGLIEGCELRGKPGARMRAGLQMKGGSSDITVRNCTLTDLGPRGVNIGGSSDRNVMRPPDAKYEAKGITVEGCRFSGSDAPICFAGADGGVVRFNTFLGPNKWVVRILQDTNYEDFVPCRNGHFENNVVVFETAKARNPVNVGERTRPETFVFKSNVWFAKDTPSLSTPKLPAREQGGTYGTDPKVDATTLRAANGTVAAKAGADALPGEKGEVMCRSATATPGHVGADKPVSTSSCGRAMARGMIEW